MKIGIVGLPNVGKSTLFNSITRAGAESANYPFCTIEPNVGVVSVPDPKLEVLAKMHSSEKIVPSYIEFVDIAGLVKGASKGEGLGNKFLSHIREVDAIVEVVRCFESSDIVHVSGKVDPVEDAEIIEMELIYADLETIKKRKERLTKLLKADKKYKEEFELIENIEKALDEGKTVRSLNLKDDEQELIKDMHLLTNKRIIFVANVSEETLSNPSSNKYFNEIEEYAKKQNTKVIPLCVKLEEEISEIEDEEERKEFLIELGMDKSGLDRLVTVCYDLLGLMSFLTAGEMETRAWTIKKGTKAPEAAGKIHSDIQRGFIKAEIISYDDLIKEGSRAKVREKGLIRMEGKDYIMQEGDIVNFKFNV